MMKSFSKYILAVCILAAALTARPAAAVDTAAAAGAPLRKDLLTAVIVPKWSSLESVYADSKKLDGLAENVKRAAKMMRSSLLRRGYKPVDDSVMEKIAAQWKPQDNEPKADFLRKISEAYGVRQYVVGNLVVRTSTEKSCTVWLNVDVFDHTGKRVYKDFVNGYSMTDIYNAAEPIAVCRAAQSAVEVLTSEFRATRQARVIVTGARTRRTMQSVLTACLTLDGVYDAWIAGDKSDGSTSVQVYGDFNAKDLAGAIEEAVPCDNIHCDVGNYCFINVTVSQNK